MKEKLMKLIHLFWTFFKIGAFTFGGGYAMIPLIAHEISEKKKWLKEDEINAVISISEATPGPLAINAATYIGYKVAGVLGSIFATIGLIIPSFVIIYVISLFFNDFLQIEIILKIFKGIRACVALLIIKGALTLYKGMNKNLFSFILAGSILCISLAIAFVPNLNISSVIWIVFGAILGLSLELINQKDKEKSND